QLQLLKKQRIYNNYFKNRKRYCMTLENFDQLLQKYADVIINKGIQIAADDYLLINADIEQAPLVRLLAETAYKAGAKKVKVTWADDALTRIGYENQSVETLTDIPQYTIDESNDWIAKRAKRISLRSSNPNALSGIDPSKISAAQRAASEALQEQRIATQAN